MELRDGSPMCKACMQHLVKGHKEMTVHLFANQTPRTGLLNKVKVKIVSAKKITVSIPS